MAAKDLYEKDFYQVLGVDKKASADEIKKRYRSLARDLHPDKNQGDPAREEKFKAVSEAYDILSDSKKRAEYDEARAMFERGGFRAPTGGGFQGGDFSDLFGGGNPQDIFANLFGGGMRRGPRKGPLGVEQTERGRIVTCTVKGLLPAEEATRLIRAQLTGGPSPADSIDQNRALRILTAQEDANGTIAIQYQALKRLDWLGTHYQGGLRESADIMVDFYDEAGRLMNTERHAARRTPAGDDVMSPGAVAVLKVTKPAGAKTFRVWLVK